MTRTVILLLVLYAVWRLAVVLGRRRERARRAWSERPGAAVPMVLCSRCGRYVEEHRARPDGRWPARHWVCAEGCDGVD